MKIVDIRATTVTMPLEAPLRHSNGAHWGRFVRTVVEVEADNGLIGLGEMGGGGQSAEAAVTGLKPYLVGHDPGADRGAALDARQPDREPVQQPDPAAGRDRVRLSRPAGPRARRPGARAARRQGPRPRCRSRATCSSGTRPTTGPARSARPSSWSSTRASSVDEHGFSVHKLKGGVFPPDYERECFRALAEAFPGHRVRFDPNGAFSVEEAIRFARGIEDLDNDYLEDPTWGLNGMRRVRENTPIPLATNTVVVNFEQLAANVRDPAVDVILLDTTFWGGIRPCIKAAGVCETFQLGVAVHSSGELGIQLATMLHLGAVVPNLVVRRRRALPPPARRHHCRRQASVRRRRDRGPGRTRARRRAGPRQAGRVRRTVPRARPATRTTATRHARTGTPCSRTPIGPTLIYGLRWRALLASRQSPTWPATFCDPHRTTTCSTRPG